VSRGQRGGSLTVVHFSFLDRLSFTEHRISAVLGYVRRPGLKN
jgi:hypothetical protein